MHLGVLSDKAWLLHARFRSNAKKLIAIAAPDSPFRDHDLRSHFVRASAATSFGAKWHRLVQIGSSRPWRASNMNHPGVSTASKGFEDCFSRQRQLGRGGFFSALYLKHAGLR